MSTALVTLQTHDAPWLCGSKSVKVGKDILEVLSSAMYVDPLAIYREYIQNAADAIDDAREAKVLRADQEGHVEISIDVERRSVKIRDNGIGIPAAEFEQRMTSFGASAKRGTNARGFRGVGRLSGLAYCQELIFRTRATDESKVSELRWDCREAKALLRSADFRGDLAAVVEKSVLVRCVDGKNWPEHFFEVELRHVPRLRNDALLNRAVIEDYLSQVAPLPFSPRFRFANEISSILEGHASLSNIHLTVDGTSDSTYRPHRDSFDIAGGSDCFQELQKVTVPNADGSGVAAVGWILHHGYKGAVPSQTLKGLRLRSGNIQVGTNGILEDLFVETRFNSWCVGEIHVIDSRIIPNGRRDHYEQNVHYTNLINHLSPIARDISTRCRKSSIRRNWIRQFERQRDQARHNLDMVKQGSLSVVQRQALLSEVQQVLDSMNKAVLKDCLNSDQPALLDVLSDLRTDFFKLKSGQDAEAKVLKRLTPVQRRAYQQVFSLLYECSTSKVEMKALIDKVLVRIAQEQRKR